MNIGTLIECDKCNKIFAKLKTFNERTICPACGTDIKVSDSLNGFSHNIVSYQITPRAEIIAISNQSIVFRRQYGSSIENTFWEKV